MAMRGARGVSTGERRSVEFADAPGGKPHAREASERERAALERAGGETARADAAEAELATLASPILVHRFLQHHRRELSAPHTGHLSED